ADMAALAKREGGRARLLHLRRPDEDMKCEAAAIDGLLRAAAREYPDMAARSVESDGRDLAGVLRSEDAIGGRGFEAVRWRDGARSERAWSLAPEDAAAFDPFAGDGTVLITGGLGGIGRALAGRLSALGRGKLALVGRRDPDADERAWLSGLGGEARYFRCDIADRESVIGLIGDIEAGLGPIGGVLHAAGHLEDSWLANLTDAGMQRVLTPKVRGALNLDAALAGHEGLRFFMLFSSLAGSVGQAGQAAYGAANAWLDHIAAAREALRARGLRHGVCRSVAWPLWAEGGMALPPEGLADLAALGLQPLPTASAVLAIGRALSKGHSQSVVLWGEPEMAAQKLGLTAAGQDGRAGPIASDKARPGDAAALLPALASIAEEILKLPPGRLDPAKPLSAYGFDSITLTRFASALHDRLGIDGLAPATFLDQPTMGAVAGHLAGQGIADMGPEVEAPAEDSAGPEKPVGLSDASRVGAYSLLERARGGGPGPAVRVEAAEASNGKGRIAVTGIGCRFPGAEDTGIFWRNLIEGKRSFVEVPADRWDWRAIDGDPAGPGNRTDCRFGGYIADIAGFDAALFAISEGEARAMDPQHRLVLEAAWAMLEDAGLGPDGLAGRKVGAFVGVQRQEYQSRLTREAMGGGVNTGNSHSMLVNRLSYLFGWTGPSLAVDAGCASSGLAIHQAIGALRAGECSHAVAGGVNIVLAPESVVVNRRMGLLTGADHVRPYDVAADGHLFADGVGLVLLRPLKDALADGDVIHGVIAGTAANHNGAAMYLTAPSPRGQAEVIGAALADAGIDAGSVDYVEGQGAAATLVDGAELDAFARAFGGAGHVLPLGSLKGNLGHLESASGVASLIKTLFAVRTGRIPATLGHESLNWDEDRGPAPVDVVSVPRDWPDSASHPRRAAVHNFGYGGANVHFVVEAAPARAPMNDVQDPVLVPLSAPSEARLRRAAAALARHIEDQAWRETGAPEPRLADIAFTLQTGRREFDHRAAFAVSTKAELVGALRCFADSTDSAAALPADHDARTWLAGEAINWSRHRAPGPHRRLSLPGTSFEHSRFWAEDGVGMAEPKSRPVADYYDSLADSVAGLAEPDDPRAGLNLLFAPLPRRLPGFSWIKAFFGAEENPDHLAMLRDGQTAMKARLFDRVDLSRVSRAMDFGCGFATDLIDLAQRNPGLVGRGFTIAPAQAAVAAERVAAAGLDGRVEILPRDSARDDMGGPYDLMLGFEVSFHVADKQGLFANIARNLAPNGDLLLIDCIAETAAEIAVPEIGQYTPTATQFAEILATHGLAVVAAEDASGGIANFLHDPDFERHLDELHERIPALAARAAEHRGWERFGEALSLGLIRYLLLHLRKDDRQAADLAAHNRALFADAPAYGAPRPTIRTAQAPRVPAGGSVEDRIAASIAALQDLPLDRVRRQARFADLGIDSLKGLQLVDMLSEQLGMPVRMTDLFDHPSVGALAAHLAPGLSKARPPVQTPITTSPMELPPVAVPASQPSVEGRGREEDGIAVIGLAARFPGAEDAAAFWRNLREGRDSVGPLPDSRKGLVPQPPRCEAGFLDGIERFDPAFFAMTPREAAAMDPQQRIFLEQCWHAIEDAGIAPSRLRGVACGVVAGVQPSEYGDLAGERDFEQLAAQLMTGNATSAMAARIAYLLDLRGPALSVDTACSSSLVAVHQAARMLRHGEADLMLAGGVSLFLSDKPFRMMTRAGMLADGGRCRAFSDKADGIAVAEGAGVVVLKRLADARRDGDRIWGVIRGSAVNQDGATNGLTAPSRESQRRLALAAPADAKLRSDEIDVIEAHGTGTPLGDPIEAGALSDAYGARVGVESIALGSVKSNIGHASAAAGIAGLIKALLSLAHEAIPASLHIDAVNPHIALDETPFRLARTLEVWPVRPGHVRRVAVNSLGFSGTNCHLLVEEGPEKTKPVRTEGAQVFVLSARTEASLRVNAEALAVYLTGEGAGLDPAAVAASLQDGREGHAHRLAVMADGLEEAGAALAAFARHERSAAQVIRGEAGSDTLDELVGGEAGAAFVRTLLAERDLARLARLWCRGVGIDWSLVRGGRRSAPVWLPPHRFDPMRCWLTDETVAFRAPDAIAVNSRSALLVPDWVPSSGSVSSISGGMVLIGEGIWAGLGASLGAEIVLPS
ncbi:MAG: SDR family NAD(P)-dependent oxidoreductase, partial [Rhodospirillaceae bacterium]|nr:SDR family NAD(P)-dependent oxidoreductase [Rhodospirillaceae bacterium]